MAEVKLAAGFNQSGECLLPKCLRLKVVTERFHTCVVLFTAESAILVSLGEGTFGELDFKTGFIKIV